jgi:hypothetical protein
VRRGVGALLIVAGLLVGIAFLSLSSGRRHVPVVGPSASGSPGASAPGPPVPADDVLVTGDDSPGSYVRHDGASDETMRACSTGRRQQNEPSIAVDPRDPAVVVAGANDYCAAIVNGDPWVGYYRSTDAGRSWSASLVPGYPDDDSPAGRASPLHGECTGASDPTQAFDGEGRLFYGFICLEFSGDARDTEESVTASTYVATYDRDGGRYVRTALVARGDRTTDHDKINIAVDQSEGIHGGNVYAAWVEIASGEEGDFASGTILFARSTDHGTTFSKPREISNLRVAVFPDVAVGPDGEVYVSFRTGLAIRVQKSTDGGVTFSGSRVVTSIAPFDSDRFSGDSKDECGDGPEDCPGRYTFSRFQSQAAVTADGGGVYVVWNERFGEDQSKVRVRSSGDGLDWSRPPVTIDPVETGHQYFPDIASADGIIWVVYYDSRNDSAYSPTRPPGNTARGRNSGGAVDAFVARSADGGETWTTQQVSSRSSNFGFEAVFQVPFWGDYIYISAVPGAVHIAWTDSRDIVPGRDPLEPEGKGDRDGFDVFDPCTYVPKDITADSFERPRIDDPCLSQGGYDQSIYAARLTG